MLILGIETSCDETAAAVVRDGRHVVFNEIYTQIPMHREYGGVVPELASREHALKLPYVVEAAMAGAGMGFAELDAIAVTAGPGLIGALLCGLSYAKGLAYGLGKPLVAVNHIEGHICANYITHPELEPPFVCLVVSGGHSHIVVVEDYGQYRLLGATRDDAAGEAFDKIARILGLPYPGGPELERLAAKGDDSAYRLPIAFRGEKHLDFSFSGLKTATAHIIEQGGDDLNRADVAASFQKAVVSALVKNTFEAARREGIKKIAIAGGVSANGCLRKTAQQQADREGCALYVPELRYCTDNAAMIASAGYFAYGRGDRAPLSQNAYASMKTFMR